ncbi:hypothetical protein [Pseudomonas sp. NPDC087615]|uniref:hypothetical protein n=1 Tax=Pseudomonas sp. NPDC087615 TaxID=3364443 RepID=UPI003824E539
MTSDDKDQTDPGIFGQQEKEPITQVGNLNVAGDAVVSGEVSLEVNDGLNDKPPPIQLLSPSNFSIQGRAFSFTFRIPWAGVHQVWVDYMEDGEIKSQISGEWFSAGTVNSLNFSYTRDGAKSLRIQWRRGEIFSDYKFLDYYISDPLSFDEISDDFKIQGYGGTGTTAHAVHVLGANNRTQIGPEFPCGTRWEAPLFTYYPPRRVAVGMYQTARYKEHTYHRLSSTKEMLFLYMPRLSMPVAGQIVRISDLSFIGKGHPGLTLKVVRQDNHYALLSETSVEAPEVWQLSALKDRVGFGELTVEVQYHHANIGHGYSKAVTFFVNGMPEILEPQPSTLQDSSFLLEGRNGLLGALIEVFEDQNTRVYGTSRVSAENGDWSVSVTGLSPGNIGLVVEQSVGNMRSGRGNPRAFKIRPPVLESVDINFPTDTSATFFGSGHFDGRLETQIQFTVKSGPGTAPPNTKVNQDGKWQTAATDWPFGTSTVEVIQKVPDGDSGWIESHPYGFVVTRSLTNVEDITFTPQYRPSFSGKGFSGATVRLVESDLNTPIAPAVQVQNGKWSSAALEEWGPTFERKVYLKQFKDEHQSPDWIELLVNIPPLAPGVNEPIEDGLSPKFSGTCWPGAQVNLIFNDNGLTENAVTSNDTWTYQRPTPFAPDVEHTVAVYQIAAWQKSVSEVKSFRVSEAMRQPIITFPQSDTQVGRDVTIEGTCGMRGATLQLWDAQYGWELGEPKVLEEDGEWAIELTDLKFGPFTIYAVQKRNEHESERSEYCRFEVVLLPPQITTPAPDGRLTRTAKLEGRGMPSGQVEVWRVGENEPWQRDILVGADGVWAREVTLPVGLHTLRARQTFVNDGKPYESDFTPLLTYAVVPAAPFVETPVAGESVGQRVVVSGFGVPGDTVGVTLGSGPREIGVSSAVLEDRTWSVTLELDQPDGNYVLGAVATCDGFESAVARRSIVLGTYRPSIDEPTAGGWVSDPVSFAGQGREGSGQVVSWFNPDVKWSPLLSVSEEGWRGEYTVARTGGQWCRFRQTFNDETGKTTFSAWVDSARFDVQSAPLKKT